MTSEPLNPDDLGQGSDWVGNNAAFTCPACSKVFLVSGLLHKQGRACPSCGRSKGYVNGGKGSGGSARLDWDGQRPISN